MRLAAIRYANECNLFNGASADFKQLKQQLSRSGRKIEISRTGPFFLAKTTAQLQRKLKTKSSLLRTWNLPASIDGLMKRDVLCGDVHGFVSQLNELRKAGVDRFYFDLFDPKDKEMVDLLTNTLRD